MHVLQRNHGFRSLVSFWAATPLQSLPLSPLFIRHTHAQTPTLQPQNPWLSHFLTLWPQHLEQSPPPPPPPGHQALCYSLFLQKQTQDISQNISAKQHCPSPLSVCTVCVCMHVHVCVCVCIFCIVTLEPLTTLFGSFFIIFFLYTFLLLITFPSQCTLCVLYYAC